MTIKTLGKRGLYQLIYLEYSPSLKEIREGIKIDQDLEVGADEEV